MTFTGQVYALIVCGCICLCGGLAAYRLCLHPLAAFPGPRLAAVTKWYEAYYEFVHEGGIAFTPHIRHLHAKYGPIVRIGPNELSVDDAEFHDQLYSPQPAVRDRHPHFSSSLGTTKGSFSTVDHHIHRHRRIAYNGFFSMANVMASEPLLRIQVDQLCNKIEQRKGHELELKTMLAAFSFNVFHTFAFGKSLELLDDLPMAAYCNETVEELVTGPAALVVRIFPSLIACARTIPHWILEAVSGRMAQVFSLHAIILETAQDFVRDARNSTTGDEKVLMRLSDPPKSKTVFSVISSSKAPAEEKEAARMAQEGTEMFMAAYTPGRTLLLAMYYLHSRPSTLQRLREELDSVNPDRDTIICMRVLDALPFLRAVTKELLRVTFPVGSRLPLIAHEQLTYESWIIPSGTPVSVNHRNLLFDADVFPNPEKFEPERWLGTARSINEKRYYIPFGKGGRGCPAKDFATHLIQICLATLVQRFEFELVDTVQDRDIRVHRESLLTAPSVGSKGPRFSLKARREAESAAMT